MNLSDAAKALEMMEQGYFAIPRDPAGREFMVETSGYRAFLGHTPVNALAAAYDALYVEKETRYAVIETVECLRCGKKGIWNRDFGFGWSEPLQKYGPFCHDGCNSEDKQP